jgi:hypothetical protein
MPDRPEVREDRPGPLEVFGVAVHQDQRLAPLDDPWCAHGRCIDEMRLRGCNEGRELCLEIRPGGTHLEEELTMRPLERAARPEIGGPEGFGTGEAGDDELRRFYGLGG